MYLRFNTKIMRTKLGYKIYLRYSKILKWILRINIKIIKMNTFPIKKKNKLNNSVKLKDKKIRIWIHRLLAARKEVLCYTVDKEPWIQMQYHNFFFIQKPLINFLTLISSKLSNKNLKIINLATSKIIKGK